jgi:hypothetical protein
MTTITNKTVSPTRKLDPSVLRDLTWWSWLFMIALLAIRFAGFPQSALIAIALCAALTGVDLILKRGEVSAMSVQIRLSYVALLIAGLLPWMGWIHAVQLAGTTARLVTGYCLLERELRLLPWNRVEPLTFAAAWGVLAAPPGPGGLLRLGRCTHAVSSPCAFGQ